MDGVLAWAPAALMTVVALAYLRGAALLRRRTSGRAPRRAQVAAFAGGALSLVAALSPPLDRIAERSLPWHMVQHEVIWLVAAPLLVLGAPGRTIRAGLGGRGATSLVPRWAWSLRAEAGTAVGLTAIWLGSGAVLWLWHAPPLYDAAVAVPSVHALEHVSFLVAAGTFWWALVAARRRAGSGAALLALILASFQSAALGALLTFSAAPWFSAYPSLTDQRVAGLVMWIPGGVVYLVAAAAVFLRWLAAEEARVGRGEPRSSPRPEVADPPTNRS